MRISQRTGEIIIVVIIVLLNIWIYTSGGGHSGRGQDYYESQTDADNRGSP